MEQQAEPMTMQWLAMQLVATHRYCTDTMTADECGRLVGGPMQTWQACRVAEYCCDTVVAWTDDWNLSAQLEITDTCGYLVEVSNQADRTGLAKHRVCGCGRGTCWVHKKAC
jgi:hypothetical protein